MSRKALQFDYARKILSEISELNVRLLVVDINPCEPNTVDKIKASKIRLKALYNFFTK